MSCTNPLKAFTIGINKETGKKKLKVCSRDVTYLFKDGNNYIKCFDNLPVDVELDDRYIRSFDYISCGSCLSCQLAKSKDWATRVMLECMYHEDNWFITLTYNDDSLVFNFDDVTGEFSGKSSTSKRDVQNFIKRLRKNYYFDNHLSYLAVTEYGSNSFRPHAHLILFGLKLDDLKEYRKTDLGYSLYTSDFLNRCWNRGYVVVAPATYESACYVARYTTKKLKFDDPDIYEDYLLEKEKLLASQKPSIGYQYYVDHRDEIYKYDCIVLPEGKVVKPPKYFDRLYEREFPDRMAVIKANRKKIAEITNRNELEATDYDFDQLLLVKDKVLRDRTKSLKRKEV